jgi:hypothetical protein
MLTVLTLLVLTLLPMQVLAQALADSINDRVEIQEELLYAYAYTYDAKDCVDWSNLFTTDAVLDLGTKVSGRDAIREACIA